MSIDTWLLFCATETVLCFTPGPAVLLVISTALARGGRDGMRASFGILAANTAYFALSATSLGALLVASWELFSLIKWLGAAYLVWLGARAIVSAVRGSAVPAAGERSAVPATNPRSGALARGFFTQAANPKSLLFFTAILPQFIDARGAIAAQVAILGASSVAIELGVLSLYVAGAGRARGVARGPRWSRSFEAAGGALLVFAGARLAALRR